MSGSKRDAGGAELAGDAPPVRVAPVPRALHQLALGDLPRAGARLVVGERAGDAHLHDLGVALGVADHLLGQVEADRRRPPALNAAGSAGGPAAPEASRITVSLVDVHPSVDMALKLSATPARSTSVSSVGLDGGVGGEHREHRRHVRGEHGGALRHPADDEAVALDERLLAMGVGGAHRLGGIGATVGGPGRDQLRDPGEDRVHRQPVADEPGGAHQHLVGGAAELGGHRRAHGLGVLHARARRWRRWRSRC